eukprot:13858405-Alexandrium_andersonii.AAC.1
MRAGPLGPPPRRETATCVSAPSLRPVEAALAHEASRRHRWGGRCCVRPSSPLARLGGSEGLLGRPLRCAGGRS